MKLIDESQENWVRVTKEFFILPSEIDKMNGRWQHERLRELLYLHDALPLLYDNLEIVYDATTCVCIISYFLKPF